MVVHLSGLSVPRHECVPFRVVLVGGDELVSAAAQALVHTSDLAPEGLTFSLVPTGRQQVYVRSWNCRLKNVITLCCSDWPGVSTCV